MKDISIFRDTVDRYQFVSNKRILIPKFDDLPIKQVKTEYVVTEMNGIGVTRHVFDTDEFNVWLFENKKGLEKRIRLNLINIERVNVFEADI